MRRRTMLASAAGALALTATPNCGPTNPPTPTATLDETMLGVRARACAMAAALNETRRQQLFAAYGGERDPERVRIAALRAAERVLTGA